ncbi:MAG: FkbM family methyltransferase [Saprospiraceae bacterium]|nr:FkbM family methyltransferase [Saprospiraceae bacterium]MBP7699610.1 FkbM family methyltransferase [Saprospiraceae bacterium]
MLAVVKNIIKKIIQLEERRTRRIATGVGLNLDISLNKSGAGLLREVFVEREYANFFPFNEKVIVVDIGAHYGYFSLFAAQHTHPESIIWALEPSPTNFHILQKNIASNAISNIIPLNIGISDSNNTAKLFLSRPENHSIFGSGQEKSVMAKFRNLETFMREQDINRIDFLKIDCEGAEYPILLSTQKAQLERVDVITLEFHDLLAKGWKPADLYQHLVACGFRIERFQYYPDYGLGNMNFGKLTAINKMSHYWLNR